MTTSLPEHEFISIETLKAYIKTEKVSNKNFYKYQIFP